ncbi:MAG: ATP-binding protein [Syntrophobacteraceae bacterium]|nr:ATP-binding protein [Syntrophobacteraceae bacterium]
MGSKLMFVLNIRQKVILGLTILLVAITSVGLLSYHYLREIERKQHFVEVADDLGNTILELRRYEKNYLLYGDTQDLVEHHKYVQLGLEILRGVSPEARELKAGPLLKRLEAELLAYNALMRQLEERSRHPAPAGGTTVEDQLRERGKSLVDVSQELVSFERRRILSIVTTLKAQLLASLGVSLVVGAFLIPIVARKIIKPLRVIEKTTLRIAQGDFRPLPVMQTHDETQRVVEAFNRMTAELEKRQDQLLQSRKLASLGTLTSGIAHQLNNPLNNISTSCQILLEELQQAEPELMHRMLSNIEQEVHRARDIVRGLLEFSRIKEFCLVPTSLREVVDRSVSLISSQVPPGIEIVREIPADLSLSLDAQRMQQVLLNLIENAIHGIGDPPGQIRITARTVGDPPGVRVVVEDTGKGIPEHLLGRIFDPFFTTKEVGAGTGLGLSIVYGIIQKHGGTVSVESRPGEGARFTIALPAESVC